ncbi:MAG: prolipoprotein diacylglyceryl transferase [Flavobacteriales bacterium]|nr:prolipoprotein diacylglyceryl transferase [Flavobacteriales bacterium]
MYPTFYDLVLDLFGISVPAFNVMQMYGMMVGLGFIVGSILLTLELQRKERIGQLKPLTKKSGSKETIIHPYDHVGNIAMICCFGAIAGGKLFHNLENWDEMMADPMAALTSMGGFSFLGGLIVSMGLFAWYAKRNKLSILHFLDAVMPSVAIGYGFGRLGCHISGDGDWGIPNDSPMPDWLSFLPDWMWAYNYPNNVLHVDMIQYFADKGYTSLTGYAYPTPIYEIIMSIFMFAFMWSMRKRWTVPGIMLSVYLILSGIERLLIEQIRINNEYNVLGGITQAEMLSLAMVLIGAFGLYYMPKVGERWAKV